MSWGTGSRGELGLGPDVLERRTPCVIRGLTRVEVRSVVAGAAHALCVSLQEQVGIASVLAEQYAGNKYVGEVVRRPP